MKLPGTLLAAAILAASAFPARAADPAAAGGSTRHIADCENGWFVVGDGRGGGRLGFVYIDAAMGWTIKDEGPVAIAADGTLSRLPNELEDVWLIRRIEHNLAGTCLAADAVAALGLAATPDWLANYADASAPAEHQLDWGSHYNHIGATVRALEFLREAKKLGAEPQQLAFELAYAHNANGDFAEAVAVLDEARRQFPDDTLLLGELAYAQMSAGDPDAAIATYEHTLEVIDPAVDARAWEYAQNLAIVLEGRGGRDEEAAEWRRRARQWRDLAENGPPDPQGNASDGAKAGGKSLQKGD